MKPLITHLQGLKILVQITRINYANLTFAWPGLVQLVHVFCILTKGQTGTWLLSTDPILIPF